MKYFCTLCSISILLLILLPKESKAQNRLRPYLNARYITNFKKCADCKKADTGGSIRIGVFSKGRFGYYVGYTWFKEYHQDYVNYDDKGSAFIAGIDFLVLRKGWLQWYIKGGIANEKYTSNYPNSPEVDTSIKPDFGFLFNINHFNTYVGWQPSDPPHINIGVGFTY